MPRILFTTFTANLAEDIKSNLRKICSLDELQKIEVINIDAWVMRFLSEIGFSAKIEYGEEIDKLWQRAIVSSLSDLDFPWSFYKDEWNRVVIPQEALSLEKYVKAKRTGRGVRLDRKKRIEVWNVFDAYLSLMKEEQIRDINMAMYECSKLFANSGTKNKYAHIIVDEGQDFSDNAYRLLRTIAGEEKPNDIFIVGDSHQRIYSNHPTLSKCGINVRGRSSILKINYRTTEETRKYAFALLNGISFDDLDDDVDLGDKCRSLVHGEAPVIKCFADANEELKYLNDCISDLQDRCVPMKNICIVARTKQLVKDYSALLIKSGYSVYQIKRSKADDLSHDGIRIATMHRVKGLEFQYVFIVSANNRIVPLEAVIDLYEVIEPCEKLVTATDNYGNTSTVSDCAEVFGRKVPFTTDTIRFSYTGTIYVGIDLSTIGLDINEASRNIYITLQSPDVIAHDIDPASFVFTTERDGLITEITPEEFIAKAEQLKTEQEAKAEQDGSVFKNAKVYAETAISKLIKAVPETRGYDLKFFYE